MTSSTLTQQTQMRTIISLITLLFIAASSASNASLASLILAPPGKPLKEYNTIGMLFAPGAATAPKAYEPVLKKLQANLYETANIRLWITLPTNKPNFQSQFMSGSRQALEDLFAEISEKEGRLDDRKFRIFFGGHSRGTVFTQDALKQVLDENNDELLNTNANNDISDPFLRYKVGGMILLSGSLQRKYRSDKLGSFPDIPMLTVGAELDGLHRLFRVSESYYHHIHTQGSTNKTYTRTPVVVVEGASHSSVMPNEYVSIFVRINDLKAEKSRDLVQTETAQIMNAFIASHSPEAKQKSKHLNALITMGRQSAEYFSVIIEALELEGSYNLRPACNEIKDNRICWQGSPWTEQAQIEMGKLESINYKVHDDFWKVYLINPVHLPKIHNSCVEPTKSCSLNITTVSQPVYELMNGLDTGFTPTAASEIRAKLVSRQSVHFNAGIKKANFTELDDHNNVCSLINEKAWWWALDRARPSVKHRYYLHGLQLRVGEDMGPYNAGVTWIWKGLKYQRRYDWVLHTWYVDVKSPTMRTPRDYIVKAAAGFHYCKLLSPARALEWIYTDSLKRLIPK